MRGSEVNLRSFLIQRFPEATGVLRWRPVQYEFYHSGSIEICITCSLVSAMFKTLWDDIFEKLWKRVPTALYVKACLHRTHNNS